MEEQLIELQIRFEYQERTLNALNDVIIAQQHQIEDLQKLVAKLENRFDSAAQVIGAPNEKPPHY